MILTVYQTCSLILKFHRLIPGPTNKVSTENRQSKSVYGIGGLRFPHTQCVWDTTVTKFFVCGTLSNLNFRKSLTEIPRNGCGTMRAAAVTWQSPISPQMFLQTGLGRASTRQLGQSPVGGDWVLTRYSRRPHRPTPISRNFSERFSKIQVYHTQIFS
jgi:hypothetical protein